MEPDIVVVEAGGRRVAVEVKAYAMPVPDHIVPHILARLAQLGQKYDNAIMILPEDHDAIAQAASEVQQDWIGRSPHIVLLPRKAA
jgi:hypothetical protein